MTRISIVIALTLGLVTGLGTPAVQAQSTPTFPPTVAYSFDGPFGRYDPAQMKRGLQVYTEVCAACHGLQFVPLRSLQDPGGPGLTTAELRDVLDYLDPVTDAGTDRPRGATDPFPARTGEGTGPDLSLMAKARASVHGPLAQLIHGQGGPAYIRAYLLGYDDQTKDEAGVTLYHNPNAPGAWTPMPPPLVDDIVTYADGTAATPDQMATDVSAFLMWAAEPKLEARHQAGWTAVALLGLFSLLLFLMHRLLWRRLG